MVFAKFLAVIVMCFTKKDGPVLVLQKTLQTRSDRKSGWSWEALSVVRHSLLMLTFSWTDGGRAFSALSVPIFVTHHWYVWLRRLDAGCCEFLVYHDWQSCSTSARFSSVIADTGLPLPFLQSIVPMWQYFARTRLMLQ